jgi:hypothetical protein
MSEAVTRLETDNNKADFPYHVFPKLTDQHSSQHNLDYLGNQGVLRI